MSTDTGDKVTGNNYKHTNLTIVWPTFTSYGIAHFWLEVSETQI